VTVPNFVGKYDLGDTVRLRATVLGTDNLPATPSSMVFIVKNPLGSVSSYVWQQAGASVVNTGAGAFFKDIEIGASTNMVGTWYYRAHASGLLSVAEEWTFLVQPSNVL